MGRRENAGYQHFLFFPQCFRKSLALTKFKAFADGKFDVDLTLSQTTNFRLFQTIPKEFVNDNFKFDENDRRFFKRVLNTLRKEENCSLQAIFSSTGRRPVSQCHDVVSVMHPSVRPHP